MDLKLIATDASYGEIVKAGLQIRGVGSRRANFTPQLLKLVLITSIHSSNAEKYITKMISLSTSTQEKLKEIIIDVRNRNRMIQGFRADRLQLQSSEPVSEAEIYPEDSVSSPVNPTFDLELAFEERISQIMADNENLAQDKRELQKDLRDLHNRLERLQENNDTLQGRLTKAEDALQLNGSANGPQGSWAKQLETKIQQQEDVIANQEVRLADYQSSLESSEKTVEKLRRGSDKTQKLRDELDEIKTERDNLSRKANTIDKYKQKLQTSQNLEKENQALRGELDEIRQQFREVEQVRSKVSGFQLTIAEYQRILPKIEQEQHELQMMKKHLELDNATLAERWGKANEQHARDQETIADLSDRLQDLDGMRTPSHQRTGGLEEELEEGKQNEDKMRVAKTCLMWTRLTLSNRIQHLKAKNQQLSQDNDETKSRNVMLEQMRNDTEKKYEVMKQQQSDTYEQKLLLENALASVRDGHPIQTYGFSAVNRAAFTEFATSTEVFTTMRDQLKTEQQKSQDLQDELADAKRKLQDTQDDRTRFQDLYCRLFEEPANDVSVSVVDKDKLDVLEEAKTRYSPAVDNVQSENERLRKNLKDIEMDLEEHKQMLRKALGEIDSLQETGSSRKDVKSTLEDIKAALSENGGNPNFALDKRISELFDKVTDERGVLIEKEEVRTPLRRISHQSSSSSSLFRSFPLRRR